MVVNRVCYFKKLGANGLALAADVSDALGQKANSADVYLASAVDTLLSVKLVASDVAGFAVASDVTSALANKLESADIAGKLDASVFTTRVGAENALFTALKEALYIESGPSSGVEFDYTDLLDL